jgi:hypothetical protein
MAFCGVPGAGRGASEPVCFLSATRAGVAAKLCLRSVTAVVECWGGTVAATTVVHVYANGTQPCQSGVFLLPTVAGNVVTALEVAVAPADGGPARAGLRTVAPDGTHAGAVTHIGPLDTVVVTFTVAALVERLWGASYQLGLPAVYGAHASRDPDDGEFATHLTVLFRPDAAHISGIEPVAPSDGVCVVRDGASVVVTSTERSSDLLLAVHVSDAAPVPRGLSVPLTGGAGFATVVAPLLEPETGARESAFGVVLLADGVGFGSAMAAAAATLLDGLRPAEDCLHVICLKGATVFHAVENEPIPADDDGLDALGRRVAAAAVSVKSAAAEMLDALVAMRTVLVRASALRRRACVLITSAFASAQECAAAAEVAESMFRQHGIATYVVCVGAVAHPGRHRAIARGGGGVLYAARTPAEAEAALVMLMPLLRQTSYVSPIVGAEAGGDAGFRPVPLCSAWIGLEKVANRAPSKPPPSLAMLVPSNMRPGTPSSLLLVTKERPIAASVSAVNINAGQTCYAEAPVDEVSDDPAAAAVSALVGHYVVEHVAMLTALNQAAFGDAVTALALATGVCRPVLAAVPPRPRSAPPVPPKAVEPPPARPLTSVVPLCDDDKDVGATVVAVVGRLLRTQDRDGSWTPAALADAEKALGGVLVLPRLAPPSISPVRVPTWALYHLLASPVVQRDVSLASLSHDARTRALAYMYSK